MFSYFSTKTYVMGTQKNRLIELVLLRTQNKCLNRMIRKYAQFYAYNFVYQVLWHKRVNDGIQAHGRDY